MNGLKRLSMLVALGVVLLAAGTGSSAHAQSGQFVIDIAVAPGFIAKNDSVWVYLAQEGGRYDRLVASRRADREAPAHLPAAIHDASPGDYRVYLVRRSPDGAFATLRCGARASIKSGGRTTVGFPLRLGSCQNPSLYQGDYWHVEGPTRSPGLVRILQDGVWHTTGFEISPMASEGYASMLQSANEVAANVRSAWCAQMSKPLQTVLNKVIAAPPRDGKVVIEGPWIDDPGSGALANVEADAAMIRGMVDELKRRCWNWFRHAAFNTRDLSPSEKRMFGAVKILVDGGLSELDELNQIATILETQAR